MYRNTLLAGVLALALAPPVTAQTAQQIGLCASLGQLAGLIMDNRQLGASMAEQMTAIGDNPAREIIFRVIRDAYDIPRFATEHHQRRAAQEYRVEVEAACIRSVL